MIKKIIGILFAVAVVGLIALVVINRNKFSSMVLRDNIEEHAQPVFDPANGAPATDESAIDESR